MTIDFKALGARAAAEGKDMTKPTQGGGDFEPPAAGYCRLRFIGYVECGQQKGTYLGKPTLKAQVRMFFEVSGPKHPVRISEDGTRYPAWVVEVKETLSLNEKANFFKLFTRMNYAGAATHMAQLLGESYLGMLYHRTYTGRDGKPHVAIDLNNKADGYSIRPPRKTDDETGEISQVIVDAPISPIRCFLWDYADKAQWDSLFIDGEHAERKNEKGEVTLAAKSKNVLQALVAGAANFNGSPAHALAAAAGTKLDIPDSEDGADAPVEGDEATATPATTAKPSTAPVDPLAGIVT
jgi:hypothetical protein